MQTLTNFKRGDTFALVCTWKIDGVPTSIIGLTIASQIRNTYGMTLIDDLTVTPLSGTGEFVLAPVIPDTSGWAVGNLICDIQVTDGDTVRSSDSFLIVVTQDVTR
jgi:hypothetical protein